MEAAAAAVGGVETSKANGTGEGHSAEEEKDQAKKRENTDSTEKGDEDSKPDRSDNVRLKGLDWEEGGGKHDLYRWLSWRLVFRTVCVRTEQGKRNPVRFTCEVVIDIDLTIN